MYQFDDIGSTYISLPPNLQTTENECFGYALDRQLQKFHQLAKKLTIWSDLDHVDPRYYDYLALCVKVPYYRSEYTNEMKLKLIKDAIKSHRYAGSRRAIDDLLEIIFEKAYFLPWYEYEGRPYCFKARVYDVLTEDAATFFQEVIEKVKAARSIMEGIDIYREAYGTLYAGAATWAGYKGSVIKTNQNEEE